MSSWIHNNITIYICDIEKEQFLSRASCYARLRVTTSVESTSTIWLGVKMLIFLVNLKFFIASWFGRCSWRAMYNWWLSSRCCIVDKLWEQAIKAILLRIPPFIIFSTRAKKGRKNGKSPSPQPLTKVQKNRKIERRNEIIEKFE